MKINDIKYWIIKKAKNNNLTYSIGHYFRKRAADRAFKKSLSNFHKNGYEAMRLFDQCMVENGHPYSVAFGTLLGTIRNQDFIPHDNDIDLAMWIEDYTPKIIDNLRKVGINLIYSYTINEDRIGKELTFEYKGVHIDIFFFYKERDTGKVYCCDFIYQHGCSNIEESVYRHGGLLPRKLYLPLNDSLVRSKLHGIEVNIPSNYKEILEFRYGQDFMTPKPGWRPTTSSIIEMPQYLGIYKAGENV